MNTNAPIVSHSHANMMNVIASAITAPITIIRIGLVDDLLDIS